MKLKVLVPHEGRAKGDIYQSFDDQVILHALNHRQSERVDEKTPLTVKAKPAAKVESKEEPTPKAAPAEPKKGK